MTWSVKTIMGIVAFVLVIAGVVFGYNMPGGRIGLAEQQVAAPTPDSVIAQDTSAQGEPERMKAPDFTVVDADGNSVKLSDMVGKPVVLNFWASWCPPCKSEMPEFDKVYAEQGEDVTFMMVDLTDGQQETKEKGAKYVADMGFAFPVYFDTEREADRAYGIRSIPTTLFIDQEGYVVTGATGQIDEKMLRYGIDLLLEQLTK